MLPPQPSARAVRTGVLQNVLGVLVIADVGAVQRFHHLAVNPTRDNALLEPQLLALLGRAPIGAICPRCWPNWAR